MSRRHIGRAIIPVLASRRSISSRKVATFSIAVLRPRSNMWSSACRRSLAVMVQRLWATWTFDPAAGFQAAALHQADGGVGDRFGRQAMGRTSIEAEHVAGQMERADLAPSVVEELVGANRAADHLI